MTVNDIAGEPTDGDVRLCVFVAALNASRRSVESAAAAVAVALMLSAVEATDVVIVDSISTVPTARRRPLLPRRRPVQVVTDTTPLAAVKLYAFVIASCEFSLVNGELRQSMEVKVKLWVITNRTTGVTLQVGLQPALS